MPDGRILVDYTPSGRGGSALLISSKLWVSEVGTSGFGGAAWAMVDGEDWLIAGDFNNVELQDDSRGKSALIRGAEERAWRRFSYRTDMVDAYLAAAKTEGGLYTRLAFCGDRFDRARLDRFYLTNRGEWCEAIKTVKHYSDQLLSDHIPIALELQLVQDDDANWKPRSYFKMSNYLVNKPGVLEVLNETWSEHPPFCRSSQKRWELAWGRIKQVLKHKKDKNQLEAREIDDVRREVQDLRRRSETEDLSTDAVEILKSKEAEIRSHKAREAKLWKTRSKDRWLREGETPSKYFYQKLKAKYAREKITVLETTNGDVLTNHKQILQELEDYYRALYTRGRISQQVIQARTDVLQNLTMRISEADDHVLTGIPTPQEVDEVVDGLSPGKSPGFDGITAETLRLCWNFIRADCIDMVQEYWCRGALTEKTRTAVIKLLPKNDQTQLLSNWRPLSLMGLTYKLLAKIMANRVKTLMHKLVDRLQTGFIQGRNIASSLISLKLGHDWAAISDQNAMFL
ncbi:hypothetical protein R1sor_015627 [Riccia sorocarpa]|uniref:Reverse transcriptase domain-containing protein n=1 Tax=Riccia sorocarpa TaxID=122646 RepID=A0ABD3HD58_9MARC